jgi:hypothetical protein
MNMSYTWISENFNRMYILQYIKFKINNAYEYEVILVVGEMEN